MKSFDQMADDFVEKQAKVALPYVIADEDRVLLELGYFEGLSAGIEFCANALESKEEKGL